MEPSSTKKLSFKKIIKSLDNFGTPIQLNNGNGNTRHNTFTGGIASLLVNGIMFFLVTRLVIQMVTYGNQNIGSTK